MGGKIPFKFTLTVGKYGWAYGYWDSQPSKIEPDYLHQYFKELYVTIIEGGLPYMYLTVVGQPDTPQSHSQLK